LEFTKINRDTNYTKITNNQEWQYLQSLEVADLTINFQIRIIAGKQYNLVKLPCYDGVNNPLPRGARMIAVYSYNAGLRKETM